MALGAANEGLLLVVGVYMVSSLLNVGYLLPLVVRGFFFPPPEPARSLGAAAVDEHHTSSSGGFAEAPLWCVVPPCLTAVGCIVLFFYADPIYQFLLPLGRP